MSKKKSGAHQTADQLLEVYHGLCPVIKAYEELVKAMEEFEKGPGNWPRVHLGLPHYRFALKETREHQAGVLKTSHMLRDALP